MKIFLFKKSLLISLIVIILLLISKSTQKDILENEINNEKVNTESLELLMGDGEKNENNTKIQEPYIKEVDTNGFQQAIISNKYTLAIFYYHDKCRICDRMLEIAEEMIPFAKESEMSIIKIEAESNFNLFKTLGFKILPGVLFSIKGYKPLIYEGEHSVKDLTHFIRKMTFPIVKTLTTVEEVENFKTLADVTVIEFSKEGSHSISLAARNNKHILFAFCNSLECLEKYNPDLYSLPNINDEVNEENRKEFADMSLLKLFKSFDERENTLIQCSNPDKVNSFIEENSYPALADVSETTLERIFQLKKDTIILFDDSSKSLYSTFNSISGKLRSYGLIVVYSDPSQKYSSALSSSVGITQRRVPTAAIVSTKKDDINIFRLKNNEQEFYNTGEEFVLVTEKLEITSAKLISFAHDWKYDQLKPELKSGPITPLTGDVVKLVGSNILEVALDTEKAVLVEFYSPECTHCKEFAATYEELGRITKPSKNLIIASFDVTKNIVNLPIQSIPTVLIFSGGKRPKQVGKFEWDRNLEDLVKFLRIYSGVDIELIDEDMF